MFRSELQRLEEVVLPQYSGTRIMMMPYHVHDPEGSLPEDLGPWFDVVRRMGALSREGVGYLTIDEAMVAEGETHRRPGLHVDGIGPDGDAGGWGSGGGYGSSGMTMVSSHVGCVAWEQVFHGYPAGNGDCAHLVPQLCDEAATVLEPNVVYLCSPLTVHCAIPMEREVRRQFCRVSFPSDAPWYEGYTENPRGIRPTGPVHPRRTEFMNYRP